MKRRLSKLAKSRRKEGPKRKQQIPPSSLLLKGALRVAFSGDRMSGYRPWLILTLAFAAMTMLGSIYIYGVFFSPIEAEYGWSRGALSIAYSVFMALYAAMQLISGTLYDLRGPKVTLSLGMLAGIGYILCSTISSLWQLYLFYGVVAAVGTGSLYVPCTSTAMKWFPHRKGLATGFVVAGLGVGMIVLPPLSKYLIAVYGWRLAFSSLGVMFMAVMASTVSIVEDPSPGDVRPMPMRKGSAKEALKSRIFWLIYTAFSLGSLAGAMVIIHVVPYAEDLDIPALAAAFIVSLIGISNIAGRIGIGAIVDRVGVKATLFSCFLAQAACTWMLLKASSLWQLYAIAVAFGFSYGWIALYAPTVGEFFGMERVGSILGALGTSFGLGAVIGPALAGVIFDVTRSYFTAFTIGALMSLLAALLIALIKG